MGDAMIERRLADRVREGLLQSRVVHIVGARQSGKSTLAQLAGGDRRAFTLDDAVIRRAARDDPGGFVDGLTGPVIIDEVQRVPELLLEIKRTVDADPTAGRFLLTGSANQLRLRSVLDSLAGRVETVELWPCSQGELSGDRESFVEKVLTGVVPQVDGVPTRFGQYRDRILEGGFIEAVRRTPRSRARWVDEYLRAVLGRDAPDMVDMHDPTLLVRLIELVAGCVGGTLVPASLASQLERDQKTIQRYLDVLELTYLLVRLPAWRTTPRGRIVAKTKPYIVDAALLARLLHVPATGEIDARSTGALLENFVIMELIKQAGWQDDPVRVHHYRDRDGREVDIIIEGWDGSIAAIEVKSTVTIRPEDWSSIRYLRDSNPERFVAGVVLHPTAQTVPLGNHLWSVPLCAVWSA